MISKTISAMVFVAVLSLCLIMPELVFAQSPFTSATGQFKSDAITIFQAIAFLAVMAVGVLCALGRINKGWLVGCVIGIILIFGADQIITWIRGAAGV